jgi:hypothetical protein
VNDSELAPLPQKSFWGEGVAHALIPRTGLLLVEDLAALPARRARGGSNKPVRIKNTSIYLGHHEPQASLLNFHEVTLPSS